MNTTDKTHEYTLKNIADMKKQLKAFIFDMNLLEFKVMSSSVSGEERQKATQSSIQDSVRELNISINYISDRLDNISNLI